MDSVSGRPERLPAQNGKRSVARHRQEVLNVVLAQILQERGVISAPESIVGATGERGRRMLDVVVDYSGLRTVIEGEVGDKPTARRDALASAVRRVEEGIAHIGVAVVYPSHLRGLSFSRLKRGLEGAELELALATESGTTGFLKGNVDTIAGSLRGAFAGLVQEDVVARAVEILDAAIGSFAAAVGHKPGILGRLRDVLGIGELSEENGRIDPEQADEAVGHIGALVLVNAMIFQEVLAEEDQRVPSLETTLSGPKLPVSALRERWVSIVEEIDYFPIFNLAAEAISRLTANPHIRQSLVRMADAARAIVDMKAALRHDLMGRVYHRLLAEKKYLATYYTGIPAAVLLAKLASRPDAWELPWHDLDRLSGFHVADLACGTGTLLMSAADAITDNYIAACAARGEKVDTRRLQKALAEKVLHGYDVLPSAIHLTASTLALRAPSVPFEEMNLYSLPLGGGDQQLGSIEFLNHESVQTSLALFATPSRRMGGKGVSEVQMADVPAVDLCVMNPPFTRSVGGNLLFGSLPDAERSEMQEKLKDLVARREASASITAGLGSVFVAVADPYIKPGGRIALVLPKAVLSGVAWGKTRELLGKGYAAEYLVASHDPDRWNFSESTSLSEALIVARKLAAGEQAEHAKTVAVNLWRNPTTPFEARAVAHAILKNGIPDLADGQGALEVTLGDTKVAEVVSVPWSLLRDSGSWLLPCAFAQSDLIRAAHFLLEGKLWLPGSRRTRDLRLCPLSELGKLGPDRRDIHDGFDLSPGPTAYPAFWGHHSAEVTTLSQEPNAFLMPLSRAKKGRSLRRAADLWPLSGRLLIGERLWLKTDRACAVRLPERVLSNTWWPLALRRGKSSAASQKALTLWLNSSLGWAILLAIRLETRGAWVEFKKPTLHGMPVLDVSSLTKNQLGALARAFDALHRRELRPLSEMAGDGARAEIDRRICRALRLPDISPLRQMLAREPILTLRRL